MQTRIVLLVDLDYFFAQIEEIRNPSIQGKPVVVCVYSGRTTDSGAVSTANYEARKYGINSGIPIVLAKRRLKDVDSVFLPVDKEFYKQVSDKVMKVLRNYADKFEQVSIDEAYLDLTKKAKGNFQRAKQIASTIKQSVFNQHQLTCSIGIGPNKLLAKIAASIQKPNGLTIIKPEHIRKILGPLPVRNIAGIGKKTEKKLETFGIKTISQLSNFDVQRLIEVFGRKMGVYFHNASLGLDDEQVQERSETESISRISTLKEDTRNLAIITNEAYKLCHDVHTKLNNRKFLYKSVSIHVVASNLSVYTRSKTLENQTRDLETFKEIVKELFVKFLAESNVEVRRVGVKLSNLTKKRNKQKLITNYFIDSTN